MSAEPVAASRPEAPAAAAPRDRRRRRLDRPRVLALVALLALAAIGLWWYWSGRESTDDARIQGSVHPVASRVDGQVVRVLVGDHQRVAAGDLLLEVDDREYRARLQRAEADLAEAEAASRAASTEVPVSTTQTSGDIDRARAAVDDALAGVAMAARRVVAARSGLLAAEADRQQARALAAEAAADLERLRPLVERDEVSRQEFESAESRQQATQAARDATDAKVAVAESEVEIFSQQERRARSELERRRAELRQAETGPQQVSISEAGAESASARVAHARAVLEQARLDLEFTRVYAVADGVVSQKSVETGQFVRAGQRLLSIVELEGVWVVANFKETQLESMYPGQKASVAVDAYPGLDLDGTVTRIGAATTSSMSLLPPSNATGNFVKVVQRVPVRIDIQPPEDTDAVLRPGLSVVARVTTRSRPAEAAADDGQRAKAAAGEG